MMNQINIENLDEWFFREAEGQLNAQEIDVLNDFLEIHPEEIVTQKLWKSANFEGIEIEAYPKLDVLLKGKSSWWEKKWFMYNSIALILLFGLLFGFQSSETSVKLKDLSVVGVKILPQLGFGTPTSEKTIDQDLNVFSKATQREFKSKKLRKQLLGKKEADSRYQDKGTGSDSEFKEASKIMNSTKLELRVQALLIKKVSEVVVLSIPGFATTALEEAKSPEELRQEKRSSKKRERKHKRNSRKRENAIYEQSKRNGADPLIIPLGDFGF